MTCAGFGERCSYKLVSGAKEGTGAIGDERWLQSGNGRPEACRLRCPWCGRCMQRELACPRALSPDKEETWGSWASCERGRPWLVGLQRGG